MAKHISIHAVGRTLVLCALILGSTPGQAQTIKVWPDTEMGNGVSYGADVKLTLFQITNQTRAVEKLEDMGFSGVRIPIVAMWGVNDARYDTISNFVKKARDTGMRVFASVANTDGTLRSTGELKGAHNGEKFPSWLKCASAGGTLSCDSTDEGIYGLKLSAYKTYLQKVVEERIGQCKWVGPFNEDPAGPWDYLGVDFGKRMVGVETFGLAGAAATMSNVRHVIDVGGAHDYNGNLELSYERWENFVDNGGIWFTESTLFGNDTADGIAHILPAISAGISKVWLYQAVPRVVTTKGFRGSHYWAVKQLIGYSKGPAKRVETNHPDYIAAAFESGGRLILHVCNRNSSNKTVWVNLQQNYTVSSLRSINTYGGSANVSTGNDGRQVKIDMNGDTYARITMENLRN